MLHHGYLFTDNFFVLQFQNPAQHPAISTLGSQHLPVSEGGKCADDACLLVFMPFYDPSFCKWARPCDLLLNNRMASVMGVASTIRLEKVTSVLLADFVSFWASRL